MVIFGVALVIFVAVGVLLAWPLVFRPPEPLQDNGANHAMFNERDALLDALSELEQDFRVGKVSQADYQQQKTQYERQYVRLTAAKAKA